MGEQVVERLDDLRIDRGGLGDLMRAETIVRGHKARVVGGDAVGDIDEEPFLTSIGLRPVDVGGLPMAQTLESFGLLMIGLAKNGAGSWDIALSVDLEA